MNESLSKNPKDLVLIAVDPSHTDGEKCTSAFESVRVLAAAFRFKPVATAVFSNYPPPWPIDFFDSIQNAGDRAADSTLAEVLNEAKANLSTQIVFEEGTSERDAVHAISSLADDENAKAVLVFTHTNSGEHVFGGFTNALLQDCERSVVIVNAQAFAISNVKKIVFATRFLGNEIQAFEDAVEYAKRAGAELIISHCLVAPVFIEAAANAGVTSVWPVFEEWMGEESRDAFKEGNAWAEKAIKMGIKARFELVVGFLSVRDAILSSVERNEADVLMLAGKNRYGSLSFLLGSVVFNVAARSLKPVMILRRPHQGVSLI